MDPNVDVSNMTPAQRETVIDSVRQQVALANVQELIQRISSKCIKKCLQKPGTSLDKYDQQCLSNCMDRYIETFSLVTQTYQQKLQQQVGAAGTASASALNLGAGSSFS